jgi:hypothetical protein
MKVDSLKCKKKNQQNLSETYNKIILFKNLYHPKWSIYSIQSYQNPNDIFPGLEKPYVCKWSTKPPKLPKKIKKTD